MKKPDILIVEDEAIIALDIQESLESQDYNVIAIVNNGEDAIRLVAQEKKPDLVLMDKTILGNLDGIQTAEIIRSKLDIPIIFLTGDVEKESISTAKMKSYSGYITKPFDEKRLLGTIERALKHKKH